MKENCYAIKLEREHYPIVEKYLDDPRYNNVLVIGLTTPYTRSSLRRFLNIKNRVEKRGGNCIGVDYTVGELLEEYIALKVVEGDFDFLEEIDPSYSREFIEEDQDQFKNWLNGQYSPIEDEFRFILFKLRKNKSLYSKVMKEMGVIQDDAKELKTIKDKSIDLILAFGLFGELDLTEFQYDPRSEEEITEVLKSYEKRCDEVVDSMHRVLKPKGKCIISNGNKVRLTEFKSIIERLGYQPEYDQKFFKELFGKKFSDIEVFNGSTSYLMVCEKE